MSFHKLTSTNAFVVFDLDGVPAAGVVRSAPKILPAGVNDLARSLTYTFASFEMQRSGASAGINAEADERAAAVAAFVQELTPIVAEGRLALEPGKGVERDELAPLLAVDDRDPVGTAPRGADDLITHLAALGPVLSAEKAIGGGIAGRTVAIEGFAETGPALAVAIAERGGRVVAVSTAAGARVDAAGFDPGDLRERWDASGDAMVVDAADAAEPAWKVFATEADVLMVGSKMGAIGHDTAARLRVSAVVPHGPIPFTTRALAVMQGAGIAVVPDFLATAAPIFAWWPTGSASPDAVVAAASSALAAALDDCLGHPDGAFLAACHRAESFLRTWRDDLPFGRPLAS